MQLLDGTIYLPSENPFLLIEGVLSRGIISPQHLKLPRLRKMAELSDQDMSLRQLRETITAIAVCGFGTRGII